MDYHQDAMLQSPFWMAVCNNDVETARQLLDKDSSLASRDFRMKKDRNAHTNGFPLYKARVEGYEELAKLSQIFTLGVAKSFAEVHSSSC